MPIRNLYRSFLPLFLSTGMMFLLWSCQSAGTPPPLPELSPEEQLETNIATLKQTAQPGDLLARLSDDIISQQVTNMNEQDKSFSHCGLVTEIAGQKYVYHIAPNLPGADTIAAEPIDSFINPQKHIRCALFRYQLSPAETARLLHNIDSLKKKDIRFDPVYDLSTNDKLYCSEMIAKSLKKATNGRIICREIPVPERMQKLLAVFFKQYRGAKEIIAQRTFISPDNLYLRPDCQQLMKFNLKIFPGQ